MRIKGRGKKARLATGALLSMLAVASGASEARADTEAQIVAGVTGAKTEWRGDVGGLSMLKLAIKPTDAFSIFVLNRLGLGSVDRRMLTFISVGAQVWPLGDLGGVAPYMRLAICHQHEESLSVVQNDPFGALFGIGDGIRHRGGFEGALGMDVELASADDLSVFASFEASTVWFYDPRGPTWYWAGGTGLGLSYAL